MAHGVFLSYASQDADGRAARLRGAARKRPGSLVRPVRVARSATRGTRSIRKQIKECALFVPFISANTNAREEGYFRLEWKLAVDRTHLMAETKPFLFPVLLEGCTESGAVVPDAFPREAVVEGGRRPAAIEAFALRVAGVIQAFRHPARPTAGESVPNASPSQVLRAPARAHSTAHRMRGCAQALHCCSLALRQPFAQTSLDRERRQRFVAEGVSRLADLGRSAKFMEAFLLAREIEAAGGADNLTQAVRNGYSRAVHVTSTPPGAKIELRPYDPHKDDGAWHRSGSAPLDGAARAARVMEWRRDDDQDGAVTQVGGLRRTPRKQVAFSPQREGGGGRGTVGQDTRRGQPHRPEGPAQGVKLGAFQIDGSKYAKPRLRALRGGWRLRARRALDHSVHRRGHASSRSAKR
jgi:hypothetical protein